METSRPYSNLAGASKCLGYFRSSAPVTFVYLSSDFEAARVNLPERLRHIGTTRWCARDPRLSRPHGGSAAQSGTLRAVEMMRAESSIQIVTAGTMLACACKRVAPFPSKRALRDLGRAADNDSCGSRVHAVRSVVVGAEMIGLAVVKQLHNHGRRGCSASAARRRRAPDRPVISVMLWFLNSLGSREPGDGCGGRSLDACLRQRTRRRSGHCGRSVMPAGGYSSIVANASARAGLS
jgi:hypothetical protein